MARDRETDPRFSRQDALSWLGQQIEGEAAQIEATAAQAEEERATIAGDAAGGFTGMEVPGAVAWSGLGRRFWAQVVDLALLGIVPGALFAALGSRQIVLIGIVTGVVATIYCVGFWGSRGQTPGKMAMGIEVVTPVGGLIGPVRALVRYIFFVACIALVVPLVVSFFTVSFGKKKRAVYDFLSGTCVSRAY